MKKILAVLILLFSLSQITEAQNIKRPNPRYRHRTEHVSRYHVRHMHDYVGELRLHAMGSIGQGDVIRMFQHRYPDMYSVGAMLEYQVNKIAAIGIGAEYYSSYCHYSYPELNAYTSCIPVYANLRLMIPSGDVRPFIEGRIGYAAPIYSAHSYRYGNELQAAGLYTGASMGLIIGNSDFSIGVNVTDLYNITTTAIRANNRPWDFFNDFYVRYSYSFGL